MQRIRIRHRDNPIAHTRNVYAMVPPSRSQKAFGRSILLFLALVSTAFVQSAAPSSVAAQASSRLTPAEFTKLMERVSAAWNTGDATKAAACFSEDAQYSAPPGPPKIGRQSLFEYFGGTKGRELPMYMQWHHLAFDPTQQIGMGEYTFRYRIQTHGIVVVKIENGLIKNWREYEVESELPWDKFAGTNRF